jgi:hypothetical protein
VEAAIEEALKVIPGSEGTAFITVLLKWEFLRESTTTEEEGDLYNSPYALLPLFCTELSCNLIFALLPLYCCKRSRYHSHAKNIESSKPERCSV